MSKNKTITCNICGKEVKTRFDMCSHGAHNALPVSEGSVKRLKQIELELPGIKIVGNNPRNFQIWLKDNQDNWIQLPLIHKLTLILDVSEMPRVKIEQWVGIQIGKTK
jgi:hypothetical protein